MKKIPTVLIRDTQDRTYVTDEVSPGCEWVFAGEGVATRKFDGTCVMLDENGTWWARREVRPGRPTPLTYVPVSTDEVTGKIVGWEPIEESSFWKHFEPLAGTRRKPGTYELVGPKVQGNPEKLDKHQLIEHGGVKLRDLDGPQTVEAVIDAVRAFAEEGFEGVVWHHPDGRRAKLKARDLRPA